MVGVRKDDNLKQEDITVRKLVINQACDEQEEDDNQGEGDDQERCNKQEEGDRQDEGIVQEVGNEQD